jgi:hypothetical protein
MVAEIGAWQGEPALKISSLVGGSTQIVNACTTPNQHFCERNHALSGVLDALHVQLRPQTQLRLRMFFRRVDADTSKTTCTQQQGNHAT